MQGGELLKKELLCPLARSSDDARKLAVLTVLCLAKVSSHSPNERALLFTVYHSNGVKRCQNPADIIQIMV